MWWADAYLEARRSGIARVAVTVGGRFGLVLLTRFLLLLLPMPRSGVGLNHAALSRAVGRNHSNRLSTDSSKRRPWIMATISMRSGVIAYNMR